MNIPRFNDPDLQDFSVEELKKMIQYWEKTKASIEKQHKNALETLTILKLELLKKENK